MEVYKDFFLYQDGVYSKSQFVGTKPLGFHSIKIVGWGEENQVPYWVKICFKNAIAHYFKICRQKLAPVNFKIISKALI